jgi:Fe2+ or Zn2+ uptake regulation protein
MPVRDTSLAAYDGLQASLPRRERLVWAALAECDTPPTAYELTERMRQHGDAFDLNSVRPRLTALYEKGSVRRLGKRACRITGKRVYTWQAIAGRPPVKPKKKAPVAATQPAADSRLF